METKLSVKIDPTGAQQGGSVVDRVLSGMRTSFIDTAAKIFVVQQALSRAWGEAEKGAKFEETLSRLNRQMGGFNSNAHLMTSSLVGVTNGVISVERAASMASRALAVGLNPDQILTFAKAADSLEDVMGTDLPTAFDELVQAAITGRSAVLANIGVYVDLDEEVKKLAVSTNRTTDQITRQEKAMLTMKALTDQSAGALHRLGDGAISSADKLDNVAARYEDFSNNMALSIKTAVITSLDWFDKLRAGIEKSIETEMKGRREMQKATPGNPNNPITQQILGQAIVQDTTGNLNRQRDAFARSAGATPKIQLPTSLQGSQLDAERERRDKGVQAELERTKASIEAQGRLFELDAQRQRITLEELSQFKTDLRMQELASAGQTLARQKQMEDQFHARRVAIGFESTEERINEDERYRGKVFEINQALLANAQAFGQASVQGVAELGQAREQAEQRRGQRLTDQFKSEFEIKEALRRQDLEDTQTYYQGELDMATARFADDQEIARKERELLREQLAFKLRLTQEEVDRLLFLRKAGDFDGVRQISERADPNLSPRAVEGIVESNTAKDILLAERANDDFFAGWSRGLQKYAHDRDSAFGLSADLARRTAQGMEQGFQTFFFGVMEGKFKSFKDVLGGVLDFTKQIIAQMTAQLITLTVIRGLGGAFGGAGTQANAPGSAIIGGLFGKAAMGGEVVQRFAFGGPVPGVGTSDTVPALLTPGEFVLSRKDVQQIKSGAAGGNQISIAITVNANGSRQQSESGAAPNFSQLARDLSKLVETKLIEEQRPGGLLAGSR